MDHRAVAVVVAVVVVELVVVATQAAQHTVHSIKMLLSLLVDFMVVVEQDQMTKDRLVLVAEVLFELFTVVEEVSHLMRHKENKSNEILRCNI
jgi:hypothetical protein